MIKLIRINSNIIPTLLVRSAHLAQLLLERQAFVAVAHIALADHLVHFPRGLVDVVEEVILAHRLDVPTITIIQFQSLI